MASISIKFVNFWNGFDCSNNHFIDILRSRHDVTVIPPGDNSQPDVLFYSMFGSPEHYSYDCLKVYYTGENDVPDFNECDYAISFHPITFADRHLRYPLFMLYGGTDAIAQAPLLTDEEALGRNFCTALLRNTTACDPRRLEIIDAVESYKPIAYGGPFRNNVGGPVDNKLDFISKYKFNLALENSLVEGYVTEKIFEPFAAATIPIYWGSDYAARDFNPEAYINASDYLSTENLVEAIKRIDTDPDEYLRMLRAPKLKTNLRERYDDSLAAFLDHIVMEGKRHVVPFGRTGVHRYINSIVRPAYYNNWTRRALKLLWKFSGRRIQ